MDSRPLITFHRKSKRPHFQAGQQILISKFWTIVAPHIEDPSRKVDHLPVSRTNSPMSPNRPPFQTLLGQKLRLRGNISVI
jgi:hypothetical protein